jgi:hypothetical protein
VVCQPVTECKYAKINMATSIKAYAGMLIAFISATSKRLVPSPFLTDFYRDGGKKGS